MTSVMTDKAGAVNGGRPKPGGVAAAAGHPAGVESVMAELIKLVADDVEPLDSVHPSTMDLYRSLTRRRAPTPTRR